MSLSRVSPHQWGLSISEGAKAPFLFPLPRRDGCGCAVFPDGAIGPFNSPRRLAGGQYRARLWLKGLSEAVSRYTAFKIVGVPILIFPVSVTRIACYVPSPTYFRNSRFISLSSSNWLHRSREPYTSMTENTVVRLLSKSLPIVRRESIACFSSSSLYSSCLSSFLAFMSRNTSFISNGAAQMKLSNRCEGVNYFFECSVGQFLCY